MSKDSSLYCSKCKHKPTCKTPCYPVEHLLESVTVQSTETSINYADQLEIPPNEAFVPPLSWTTKSTKRKVFELYFLDGKTQQQTAIIIGCAQSSVNEIIGKIYVLIDKL